MVTTEMNARREDGVTLVTVRLTGDGVARRVRVDNRLDGPVWPPRCEGRPATGWDESGYEGVVPAEGCLSLGYATPAPAEGTPVAVEPLDVVRDGEPATDDDSPTDVVQRLGDPAPPREAVPLPEIDRQRAGDAEASNDDAPSSTPTDGSDTEGATESEHAQPFETEPAGDDQCDAPGDVLTDEWAVDRGGADRPADPVTAWIDRVERRVSTVERLDDAASIPTMADVLADAGGLDASRRTVRATAADRRRLLAVADRARRLADRVAASDPELTTMERLR